MPHPVLLIEALILVLSHAHLFFISTVNHMHRWQISGADGIMDEGDMYNRKRAFKRHAFFALTSELKRRSGFKMLIDYYNGMAIERSAKTMTA